jgi:hypothetical protein
MSKDKAPEINVALTEPMVNQIIESLNVTASSSKDSMGAAAALWPIREKLIEAVKATQEGKDGDSSD